MPEKDYQVGYMEASLAALKEDVAEIKAALSEHRTEERAAWASIKTQLDGLETFKSRVIGASAIGSLVLSASVTAAWRWVTGRL